MIEKDGRGRKARHPWHRLAAPGDQIFIPRRTPQSLSGVVSYRQRRYGWVLRVQKATEAGVAGVRITRTV